MESFGQPDKPRVPRWRSMGWQKTESGSMRFESVEVCPDDKPSMNFHNGPASNRQFATSKETKAKRPHGIPARKVQRRNKEGSVKL